MDGGLGGWVTGVIVSFGYWGVVTLMVAENLFPPIPSEVILPLVWHNIIPHPSLTGGVSAWSHRERHVQHTPEQRGAYHPPEPFFSALVGLGGRIGPW